MTSLNIIHTKWKIVEESFADYCEQDNHQVSIWRYTGKVDRGKLVHYAKSQKGKRYDVLTLFVQVIYILSGKRWWLGYRGASAEEHHVCSEFVAWCYFYNASVPPFKYPWRVTANDIADSTLFRELGPGDKILPGDVGLVNISKSWLAWVIRRFTNSHWNHAVLIV